MIDYWNLQKRNEYYNDRWAILKKCNYFNPYKEYEDYEMHVLDCWTARFSYQNYENLIIKDNSDTGEMGLSFKKDRFIIAFDVFLWFLSYSLRYDVKRINSISFNNKTIYIDADSIYWINPLTKEDADLETDKKDEDKIRNLLLMLEEMLKEDNSFIFKFKEDPDYLIDILEYPQHELCKYYNFTSFIFYKSIKGYDEDYFLREFYDLHKMN